MTENIRNYNFTIFLYKNRKNYKMSENIIFLYKNRNNQKILVFNLFGKPNFSNFCNLIFIILYSYTTQKNKL